MKKRHASLLFVSFLSVAAMICWFVMFLTGTDVWHATGSPDFWNLDGAPYADLRAFAVAFYGQFLIILVAWVFGLWAFVSAARSTSSD